MDLMTFLPSQLAFLDAKERISLILSHSRSKKSSNRNAITLGSQVLTMTIVFM